MGRALQLKERLSGAVVGDGGLHRLLHAIDASNASLVAIYTGPKAADDIERFAVAFGRVDAIACAQGRGALFIVTHEEGYPSPDSRERQRFAQLKDSCRASPSLFILVARTASARAMILATSSWLSPHNDRWQSVACGSFADAVGRAEAFRPACRGALKRTESDLRGSLETRRAG